MFFMIIENGRLEPQNLVVTSKYMLVELNFYRHIYMVGFIVTSTLPDIFL